MTDTAKDNCPFCLGVAAAERGEPEEANPFPLDYDIDNPDETGKAYKSDHWLWGVGYSTVGILPKAVRRGEDV